MNKKYMYTFLVNVSLFKISRIKKRRNKELKKMNR